MLVPAVCGEAPDLLATRIEDDKDLRPITAQLGPAPYLQPNRAGGVLTKQGALPDIPAKHRCALVAGLLGGDALGDTGGSSRGRKAGPQRVQNRPCDHAVPCQPDGDEDRLVAPWHVYSNDEDGVRGRGGRASSQTVEDEAVSREGECHHRLGTQPRIDLDPVLRLLGSRRHARAGRKEQATGIGAQGHSRVPECHALLSTDGSQTRGHLGPSDGPVCGN